MKKIFSGIQPSGDLHIGNYIGAIKQWVELQNDNDCIFCIVDLHAITVPQDPKVLKEKILETAALYIACGINPQKAKIFIQSENPHHAELSWILNCITPVGQLERMTQFKDKSEKQQEGTTAGLFDYPVLMAADILLYDTDEVPVGEDQKQHIELTRDLAEKFNSRFGQVFVIPQPRIVKETARIMSLQDPMVKMSKSDPSMLGAVGLLDSEDVITNKIMKAVTDSESEIKYSEEKNAVSNLLNIFSAVSNFSINEHEAKYRGKGYGEFKKDLAEAVLSVIKPIQDRYYELRKNDSELNRILDEGRDETIKRSSIVLQKAKNAVGLGR
jgi:tryptophanyl-tRNA synthetase